MIALNQFLTKDQIKENCPAAFSDTHDGKRSERYVHISSERIIDTLDEAGFGVVRARNPNLRKVDPEFAKHEIVFKPRDSSLSMTDPRLNNRIINHHDYHIDNVQVFPIVYLLNSHNATHRLDLKAGLYALLCANGLTIMVGGSFSIHISEKHKNIDAETIYNDSRKYVEQIPAIFAQFKNWQTIELLPEYQEAFADYAREIRWGIEEKDKVSTKEVLKVRRKEDSGNDLWTVYNRIQENVMVGGFKANNRRKVRTINNIERQHVINDGLHQYANQLAIALN